MRQKYDDVRNGSRLSAVKLYFTFGLQQGSDKQHGG
jgi:hypothetical protein